MTRYYVAGTWQDVRGACGHRHRTIDAALACAARDASACSRVGGYSDRTTIHDHAGHTIARIDTSAPWDDCDGEILAVYPRTGEPTWFAIGGGQ